MFEERLDYDDDVRPIGRCAECGELIYDNSNEIHLDAEQNYFCSLECSMNFYGIHKSEDCLIEET